MHQEEIQTKAKTGTGKSKLLPPKNAGKYTRRESSSKDPHTIRRRLKRAASNTVNPIPDVIGVKYELSLLHLYARVHSSVEQKVLEEMILLVQAHPDFVDKDWDNETHSDVFLSFILDQFNLLFCKKYPVFLDFTETSNPEFFWISAHDECENYGNIIPFEWVDLLKKSDKEFLQITQQFLSIAHHHLGIPAWNDFHQSCYIDELYCRLDDDDQDLEEEYGIEDLEDLKADFAYWDQGTKFYHDSLKFSRSLISFKRKLNRYKAPNKFFKSVINWYKDAFPLIEKGINFHQFEDSPVTRDGPLTDERFFQNGEAWPSMYCGFTWTFDGYIGETLSSELDEIWGNCGLIPLIESIQITTNRTEPPIFRNAKLFYDWMSQGNNACRTLFDHLKNRKKHVHRNPKR